MTALLLFNGNNTYKPAQTMCETESRSSGGGGSCEKIAGGETTKPKLASAAVQGCDSWEDCPIIIPIECDSMSDSSNSDDDEGDDLEAQFAAAVAPTTSSMKTILKSDTGLAAATTAAED